MDRLDAIAIFVAVVDAGSLAAAARRLARSPASVTRAVAQVEAEAGERLLERTTRRFAVTEAGARHAAVYRAVLGEIGALRRADGNVEIAGTVVVTAPELYGRMHVTPVVASFMERHPAARVRLLLLNRMVDLVSEGVNVAIRLAELPDSSLTAIRLGQVRRLTCAAPAYLQTNPGPKHPSGLAEHRCIGLNDAGTQELWPYREADGRIRSVRVTCALASNNAAAAIDAAERGMGIVRPLSYQVERQIADGRLETILEPYEPDPVPVSMVFQPARPAGGAARAFIDHAAPLLRKAASNA
ncbi:LysR family transcriptional regulator [Aureimonas mangrovi]|uniref:LysR family transcriptional regulator n=1 Tax=Aureimonas mangrovi TaxID=2758041 RepID=UPI00163D60EF|nr:LysR family transcriptional regulator [Aureimonas mangrovi]